MARRHRGNTSATRAALIEAATVEFAEHGYEKASLRQICSRAGLTTGALYFFFDNKEDLLRNVIEPFFDETSALVAKRRDDYQTAGATLLDENAAKDLLDHLHGQEDICKILFENKGVPVVSECYERLLAVTEEDIRAGLEARGVKLGETDDFLVNWISSVVISTVTTVFWHDRDDHRDYDHLEAAIQFLRAGFQTLFDRAEG